MQTSASHSQLRRRGVAARGKAVGRWGALAAGGGWAVAGALAHMVIICSAVVGGLGGGIMGGGAGHGDGGGSGHGGGGGGGDGHGGGG